MNIGRSTKYQLECNIKAVQRWFNGEHIRLYKLYKDAKEEQETIEYHNKLVVINSAIENFERIMMINERNDFHDKL